MKLNRKDIGKYYLIHHYSGIKFIGQLTSVPLNGTCRYRFHDIKDDDTCDVFFDEAVVREIHESEVLAKII